MAGCSALCHTAVAYWVGASNHLIRFTIVPQRNPRLHHHHTNAAPSGVRRPADQGQRDRRRSGMHRHDKNVCVREECLHWHQRSSSSILWGGCQSSVLRPRRAWGGMVFCRTTRQRRGWRCTRLMDASATCSTDRWWWQQGLRPPSWEQWEYCIEDREAVGRC